MTTDVRTRLRGALQSKGWSIERLRAESGIACTRGALHKKIYGVRRRVRDANGRRSFRYAQLTFEEVVQLAHALDLDIEVSAA